MMMGASASSCVSSTSAIWRSTPFACVGHHVVQVPARDELHGLASSGQGAEVGLAAPDLGRFLVPKVVREQAALGLDHEVEPLGAVQVD